MNSSGIMSAEFEGVELEFEYIYSPAYYSLDRFSPDEPEEVVIDSIKINDIDVTDIVCETIIGKMEEMVLSNRPWEQDEPH